jgi:hypothetical protein
MNHSTNENTPRRDRTTRSQRGRREETPTIRTGHNRVIGNNDKAFPNRIDPGECSSFGPPGADSALGGRDVVRACSGASVTEHDSEADDDACETVDDADLDDDTRTEYAEHSTPRRALDGRRVWLRGELGTQR